MQGLQECSVFIYPDYIYYQTLNYIHVNGVV